MSGSGFSNDVMHATNVDFTGNFPVTPTVSTNGQLLIGSTIAPNIKVGHLTSPLGTLAIGYSSPNITVDLAGGSIDIDSVAVQTGISPVLPDASGLITFNGAVVAAGTNPVRSDGTGVNTYALEVQTSQALAATDATKIGLCNFSSASFAVDANGFVTAAGSLATTYTGDSGAGPAVPSAGNLNIVGLAGCQTSTAGSTVTIKSPPFSQIGTSATSAKNTGEFVTAAVTRTLPASAGLIDGDLFMYVCTTAGALVIQSVTAQKIRIGSLISGAAGTATSTAIGDSVTLRFNATDGFFYAVSVLGTWTLSP